MFSRLIGGRAVLRFRSETWDSLITELDLRAGGRRESGAFLLAPAQAKGQAVTSVIYFDDLDPNSLNGGVAFDAVAFSRLWTRCSREALRVIGDVHTHPGRAVGQSDIDRNNPMVAQVGHVALIVPDLAAGVIGPSEVGVHRYRGENGWFSSYGRDAGSLLYVGRWA